MTPQPNNGDEELVELRRNRKESRGELWFEFQKVKYYFSEEVQLFQNRVYPLERTLTEFYESKGGATNDALKYAENYYEKNEMIMHLPAFKELLII